MATTTQIVETYLEPSSSTMKNSSGELPNPPLTPSTAEKGVGQSYIQAPPPLLTRLFYASTIAGLQGALRPAVWARELHRWWYGHSHTPDIVKTYEARPALPVRIFFPKSYDLTSPKQLPCMITVHGGGFVVGQGQDDDVWNRTFADRFGYLVLGVGYNKAPWNPFPGPAEDVASLVLAIMGDGSLPVDKGKVSLLGFSAGGNLAVAASQSKEVRGLKGLGWGLRSVVVMYPPLDFTVGAREKAERRRHYKGELKGVRGRPSDLLLPLAGSFDWAYIPYGTDKSDGRLSPGARIAGNVLREELPDHVCVVGAELDMLAYEGWVFARKMAGLEFPRRDEEEKPVGRKEVGKEKGALVGESDDGEERFGFLRVDEGEEGQVRSVKWVLVPDVVHGFDMHIPPGIVGDEEGWVDGNGKGGMVMREVVGWLEGVVYEEDEGEG
ncbi:alpha/beta hydrolase fold protein [Zalerion maritima]|uniref:Alpha/beta hydrolase fold protein n=1 Tax=Zalerion maritima TaxID=339359 RepID=A0AAD5RUF5_9PEZI|nr:alpha/beta hydrolase fold protein [Zalerion maritima]